MLNQSITETYSHSQGSEDGKTWDYNRLWSELVELHCQTERLTLQVTVLNTSSAAVDLDIQHQLEQIR